ncbi:MAG: RNA polymerase sigma factor SigE [Acidimicrobiia bacterium]
MSVSGEVPTWEQVARDYGRFLYTVAYRLTGNADDAEDLVQEVLLRVRRGLDTWRPGSMEGWLSRIATNAFLDQVRRHRRRRTVALPEDADRVVAPERPPEEMLSSERLGEEVQAALSSLPPEYRSAVVLCDVAGLSYQEIADALGIPVGTVRSRIHRGRALLREALG